MDKTDRMIISAMRKYCRVSYETLSRSLNLTANSIKRLINNLIDTGSVHSFEIRLTHAMAEVEPGLAPAEVNEHERV